MQGVGDLIAADPQSKGDRVAVVVVPDDLAARAMAHNIPAIVAHLSRSQATDPAFAPMA